MASHFFQDRIQTPQPIALFHLALPISPTSYLVIYLVSLTLHLLTFYLPKLRVLRRNPISFQPLQIPNPLMRTPSLTSLATEVISRFRSYLECHFHEPWFSVLSEYPQHSQCPHQSTCCTGLSLTAYLLVFDPQNVKFFEGRDQTNSSSRISIRVDLSRKSGYKKGQKFIWGGDLFGVRKANGDCGVSKAPQNYSLYCLWQESCLSCSLCAWNIIDTQKC